MLIIVVSINLINTSNVKPNVKPHDKARIRKLNT